MNWRHFHDAFIPSSIGVRQKVVVAGGNNLDIERLFEQGSFVCRKLYQLEIEAICRDDLQKKPKVSRERREP